jgi:beta-fructofuranosidase
LLLRAADTLDSYYQLRWEPDARHVLIDRWPRPGDVPFMLERPLPEADAITLDLYLEDSAITVYVNDAVALTCRVYDHRTGLLGLFVSEGEARFSNVQVYA